MFRTARISFDCHVLVMYRIDRSPGIPGSGGFLLDDVRKWLTISWPKEAVENDRLYQRWALASSGWCGVRRDCRSGGLRASQQPYGPNLQQGGSIHPGDRTFAAGANSRSRDPSSPNARSRTTACSKPVHPLTAGLALKLSFSIKLGNNIRAGEPFAGSLCNFEGRPFPEFGPGSQLPVVADRWFTR